MPKNLIVARPGLLCKPEMRKSGLPAPHKIESPGDDRELQEVLRWMTDRDMSSLLRAATDSAVKYVLDGARTWRFDLLDSAVDSDERASVGTKLQYHVIQQLGLKKQGPLDTQIAGVAVEIKGTVRSTWMIPVEGQCEITLLIRIDTANQQFAAWLMRTHRRWLNGGDNRDKKRTPIAAAFRKYSVPVVPWTPLPDEPLRQLARHQLDVVFGNTGLRRRLTAMFAFLPMVKIPRGTIEVVGAGLGDPMKRARESKKELLEHHGLVVLVGTWIEDRKLAAKFGFDLSDESWVAIPSDLMATETKTDPHQP